MIIGKNIDLRPVIVSDAEFILSLRTDDELNQHLSPVGNDIELQRQWIINRKAANNEWYFIVQNKNAEPVGTIRIYDIQDNSFCWGSWIIKKNARKYASFESVVRIHELAFYKLGFTEARVDCRIDNIKSSNFQQRFGYKLVNQDALNLYFSLSKLDYSRTRDNYLMLLNQTTNK